MSKHKKRESIRELQIPMITMCKSAMHTGRPVQKREN